MNLGKPGLTKNCQHVSHKVAVSRNSVFWKFSLAWIFLFRVENVIESFLCDKKTVSVQYFSLSRMVFELQPPEKVETLVLRGFFMQIEVNKRDKALITNSTGIYLYCLPNISSLHTLLVNKTSYLKKIRLPLLFLVSSGPTPKVDCW